VLQINPRIVVLDDLQNKNWFLSRSSDSKNWSANSISPLQSEFPITGLDEIEKKRPDLLVLKLNSSEATIIRILQNIRGNQPSLPIFIYFNSVTEQFENQGAKGRAWSFFEKQIGHKGFVLRSEDQLLDRMKKLSLPDRISVNDKETRGVSLGSLKKAKGGEKTWQWKKQMPLPA
jgi:DNA-binding NtrC family response regulator